MTAWFREQGIREPRYEWQFAPPRRWRFDLAWPYETRAGYAAPVAIEVQGGLFAQGRHNRGAAMLREYEKLNTAATLGWRILFVTPQQLCTTEFAQTIKAALGL